MNIKAALKYQLKDHKRSIIIFYIVIMLLYILFIASAWRLTKSKFEYNSEYQSMTVSHISINIIGMNMATAIFLFVSGLCSFKENFLMLRQNGISRKTIFVSRVIVNIIVALGMSIIDKVLCLLSKAIVSPIEGVKLESLFEALYKENLNGMSNMLINLEDIGFSFVIYLAFLFIGYFITIMFYRLSNAGKAIVGAGGPVFFIVVLPVIDATLAGGRIGMLFNKIISITMGTFSNLIISYIVISAAFTALSWVLMRKAAARK